ncbi:unnamed protein product [Ambrosiozyma monospora]|uniref:Unnamed protein product n=1 Tax=Ambrosiozyma monospora TaxID=43982 RepID=A0ACB5SSB0_AMBMO|nr:unnamed protein product [Ambrosiozyma monospora]
MLSFVLLVIIVVIINKVLTSQSNNLHLNKDLSSSSTSNSTNHNSNKMVNVIKSKDEFAKVTGASNLVVVDFFATWCGPCKMIAPLLEKFSKEYTSADFYKVDVDELPDVAAANEVSSMPTLLFFKAGELVGKVIGANPGAIKQALTKLA